jgi:uncharacterized membrane protein
MSQTAHLYSRQRRRRIAAAQSRLIANPRLQRVVERNINTLFELRLELERSKDAKDRLADWITGWSGSMSFVMLHVAWFAGWVIVNLGWTPCPVFDPYPFSLLTMVVSLEAIFLATFVLISQNRTAEVDAQRNDLDLQIDLLAEYELTRVLTLVDAIADHLGLKIASDPELEELKRDVAPELVVRELQQRKAEASPPAAGPPGAG